MTDNLPVPDDMPWVNLTQEEVEELRNKKYELTEYGKEQLRKLMNEPIQAKVSEEDYQKVVKALSLTHEEMLEEAERRERSNTVLARYNHFYNEECSGMPHGTPITPEHMQAMALECMVDALICENLNVEYNVIAIDDIKDLIARLYQQSDEFLERVRQNND
jgi:DNA polymerase II large subunit